ncbi:secretin N-terminal domain-containing protein [Immundisolibacter sp.]|uniref:secretin N-terminal domain-containing protein n=1 Tax=Immundisolibacter sp. TaxID=1934948 RepID=UPI003F87A15C
MIRRRPAAWLLLGLALLAGVATARPQIVTLTLQQRPAAELVPLLQPLLQERERVSGDGHTLLLSAEPARLEQLRAAVAQLDRAPRRLRITVRQVLSADERLHGAGGDDAARRVVRSPPDAGSGAQARYRGIGVHGADPTGRQRETAMHSVQALEGRPARVAVGLMAPFDSLCEDSHGQRQVCTEYREVSTGFEVLARLGGAEEVTLEVRPQAQQLAGPGTVAFALAHTQLRGPLGQWLELAGELRTAGNEARDVLASTARRDRTERRLAIKVELMP